LISCKDVIDRPVWLGISTYPGKTSPQTHPPWCSPDFLIDALKTGARVSSLLRQTAMVRGNTGLFRSHDSVPRSNGSRGPVPRNPGGDHPAWWKHYPFCPAVFPACTPDHEKPDIPSHRVLVDDRFHCLYGLGNVDFTAVIFHHRGGSRPGYHRTVSFYTSPDLFG